ncbi:unnamed protein product [Leuciscus chuanchicus]
MPPRNIKPVQQLKSQSQNDSEPTDQACKQAASEHSEAHGNMATATILLAIQSLKGDLTKQSTDMLEAINSFKTELPSHSKRIGEAEDRITQVEEDIATLQQKTKRLEETVETLRNKIQDLEDRGCRSNLRVLSLEDTLGTRDSPLDHIVSLGDISKLGLVISLSQGPSFIMSSWLPESSWFYEFHNSQD